MRDALAALLILVAGGAGCAAAGIFTGYTLGKVRATRDARLAAAVATYQESLAATLLKDGLFLRANGERPPGAPKDDPRAETWGGWERRVEEFLRARDGGTDE